MQKQRNKPLVPRRALRSLKKSWFGSCQNTQLLAPDAAASLSARTLPKEVPPSAADGNAKRCRTGTVWLLGIPEVASLSNIRPDGSCPSLRTEVRDLPLPLPHRPGAVTGSCACPRPTLVQGSLSPRLGLRSGATPGRAFGPRETKVHKPRRVSVLEKPVKGDRLTDKRDAKAKSGEPRRFR